MKTRALTVALVLLFIVPSVGFGNITIDPTSLTFGPQSIGTSSLTQYVTITFTAPHSIPAYSSMLLRGPHAAEFNYIGSCTPGPGSPGSCRIGIYFKPTSEGNKTAEFALGASGVLPLNGTGSVGILNPNHAILVFPQFVNGLGIISELTVVNSSVFPAQGEVLLNTDDGSAMTSSVLNQKRFVLQRYGVSVFQETSIDPRIAIGSLRLRFPEVDTRRPPNAVLKITIPGLGSAATGPSPIGLSFNLPVSRIVGAELQVLLNTGIAITSLSPRTRTINLSVYGDNGTVLTSNQLQLPPNGHKAAFIEELVPSTIWHAVGDHIVGLVVGIAEQVDWQDQISVIGFQIGTIPGQFTIIPPTTVR